MDKKAYLRMFRKFQASRETFYKPKFQKILQAQAVEYMSTKQIDFKPLFNMLVTLYQDISVVWGHKVHLSIKRQQAKSKQPIGFSARIVSILKEIYSIDLLQDAIDISDNTKKAIEAFLAHATTSGEGISEITAKIVSLDFSNVRARRIARTETVGAANIAGDIVAKDSGLAMNKQWLAILDSRTRHDHADVNGSTVDMNEKFNVGGIGMRFPGDRGKDGVDVPADEVVNCRCVCIYIPKTDERGLAIAA